jgi:hypothetical protein
MLSRFLSRIIQIATKQTIELKCLILYSRNFLMRRHLTVDFVSPDFLFLIGNSNAEISWKVAGCHKVEVRGRGIIPGSVNSIEFSPNTNSIDFIFYGISHNEVKSVQVVRIGFDLIIQKSIGIGLETPIGISVQTSNFLIRENLNPEISRFLVDSISVKMRQARLCSLRNMHLTLEPFSFEKFIE